MGWQVPTPAAWSASTHSGGGTGGRMVFSAGCWTCRREPWIYWQLPSVQKGWAWGEANPEKNRDKKWKDIPNNLLFFFSQHPDQAMPDILPFLKTRFILFSAAVGFVAHSGFLRLKRTGRLSAARRRLTLTADLAEGHRLQLRGLSHCSSGAPEHWLSSCGTWDSDILSWFFLKKMWATLFPYSSQPELGFLYKQLKESWCTDIR